jgi:chromosome segregation ATPase
MTPSVFSNTTISDEAASAQAVTFLQEAGVRGIMLVEGDVYEPSEKMSGGAWIFVPSSPSPM